MEVSRTWIQKLYLYSRAGAVLPMTAHLNHSCMPNTILHPMEREHMNIMSVRDIGQGEEMTVSYCATFDMMTREERRSVLRKVYRFSCSCEACSMGKTTASDARRLLIKKLFYRFNQVQEPDLSPPAIAASQKHDPFPGMPEAPLGKPKLSLGNPHLLTPQDSRDLRRELKARWEEGLFGGHIVIWTLDLVQKEIIKFAHARESARGGQDPSLGVADVPKLLDRLMVACLVLLKTFVPSKISSVDGVLRGVARIDQRRLASRPDMRHQLTAAEAMQTLKNTFDKWPPSLDSQAWECNPVENVAGVCMVASKSQRIDQSRRRRASEEGKRQDISKIYYDKTSWTVRALHFGATKFLSR